MDMTLIDSRPAIMAAFAALAEETGIRIDLAAVDTRLGIKLEDEVMYWFPPERCDAAVAGYRRHYVRLAPEHTEAMPGAADALAAVRAAGDRAVIITAKHEVSVGPSLDITGLTADEVFTHVHGEEKAVVLRSVGAAAYVGDSPPDMTAAVSAGVIGVGVSTGSFGPEALYEAGADVVLGSLTGFASWYSALATS